MQNLEMSQNAGRIILSHAAGAYKSCTAFAEGSWMPSSSCDHIRGASTERFKKCPLDDISPSDNSTDGSDPDDEFESLIAQ
uniref:Uncharacterized protein n=1 Tax=Romanomermis culicivorax TaxID=13658 RepID=A0A915IJD9_ROMCU